MAKLPALVTEVAKIDGRPRETVEHIARVIRERGYIATGKRGGGAAEMTIRDAANLLLALNGADVPKDGPLAIDRFRSLLQFVTMPPGKGSRTQLGLYESYPNTIRDILNVRTFGEAMDSLIENVPGMVASFRQYHHRKIKDIDFENHGRIRDIDPKDLDKTFYSSLRLRHFGLDVTLARYAVMIEVYTTKEGEKIVEFVTSFIQDHDKEPSFYGNSWRDRDIEVTIGAPTLIATWLALNPDQSLPALPHTISEDDRFLPRAQTEIYVRVFEPVRQALMRQATKSRETDGEAT